MNRKWILLGGLLILGAGSIFYAYRLNAHEHCAPGTCAPASSQTTSTATTSTTTAQTETKSCCMGSEKK